MTAIGSDQKLQLGQLLVQTGVVTEEQLAEALQDQRADGNRLLLGEVLVQQKMCTEEDIMAAFGMVAGGKETVGCRSPAPAEKSPTPRSSSSSAETSAGNTACCRCSRSGTC